MLRHAFRVSFVLAMIACSSLAQETTSRICQGTLVTIEITTDPNVLSPSAEIGIYKGDKQIAKVNLRDLAKMDEHTYRWQDVCLKPSDSYTIQIPRRNGFLKERFTVSAGCGPDSACGAPIYIPWRSFSVIVT